LFQQELFRSWEAPIGRSITRGERKNGLDRLDNIRGEEIQEGEGTTARRGRMVSGERSHKGVGTQGGRI